jgi:phage N-6-adenine-methyltransferase
MNKGLFSSKTDLWSTPQEFFNILNEEFKFTIDVCATKDNAKCSFYYTKEDDSLSKDWEGICWMNPPYGREISSWIKKASESKALVVCLLPARTDTSWFHTYIYNKAEIRFIKGRLKFGDSKNSAPFPSMIVVFRNN